jgi:hypothetical protein
VRTALAVLSVGLVAAAGLSCGGGSGPAKAPVAAEAHPPVVMIVLDEFSTTSLLDRHHRIDPVRYPNFASVAKDGTWFPYATASLDETGRAITSFFTGRNIHMHVRPTYSNARRNLFTLMAKRYRLHVAEEVSDMCPRRLCPGSRPQNGRSIRHKLAGGRGKRVDRWVRGIRRSSKPTFHFDHALLPHAPWRYLPSGHSFADGRTQKRYSWNLQHFSRWLVNQSYQRHLLQVGYTDRLLGRALARLRSTGLYDRSLVVVTADNGESFGRLGNGHEFNRKNAIDIALTPLLIKLPNQRTARIVRRHVRTLDVLPTVARIAHVRVPGRLDGHSVFGPAARRIPSTTTLYKRSGQRLRMSLRTLRRQADAALRLKLRLFGSGGDPPGLFGIGPRPSLHGKAVSAMTVLSPGSTRAAIDAAGRYGRVRRSTGSVPVRVMGRLTGRGSTKRRDLAVAVNGTIVATGPTFARRRGSQLFSVLVPEASLREGGNSVKLYALGSGNQLRPLTP